MSYDLIRESSVYRDLAAEDIARSKAEGQAEAAREATLLALRGRFGALPEEIERGVASAPVEALFEVLAHVATDSLEQVRASWAADPLASPPRRAPYSGSDASALRCMRTR